MDISYASDKSDAPRIIYAGTLKNRSLMRFLVLAGVFCGDLTVIVLAALLASKLRFGAFTASPNTFELLAAVPLPYLIVGMAIRSFQLTCLRSRISSIRNSIATLLVTFLVLMMVAFALQVGGQYSRLETGYMLVLALVGLTAWRYVLSTTLQGKLGQFISPTVAVLGEKTALADPSLRRNVVRLIDVDQYGWHEKLHEPRTLDHLAETVGDAERVLLAFDDPDRRWEWTQIARMMGLNAEVWPPKSSDVDAIAINNWNGRSTLVISHGPLTPYEQFLKRTIDLIITIPLVVVLLPLLVITALVIKLESPGPVFFVQQRVGERNRLFKMFKFRTMRHEQTDAEGKSSVAPGDERITRFGSFLRKYSIDELPQLFNVLLGTMSLVGPRPHALGSRAGGELFWNAVDEYWFRHKMKPGLTGLAQIRGYRGGSIDIDDLRRRVLSDIEYMNKWSITLDMKIIANTLHVVFTKTGY